MYFIYSWSIVYQIAKARGSWAANTSERHPRQERRPGGVGLDPAERDSAYALSGIFKYGFWF